jgi:acyl-CoA synthetase (AMP-forming)/AMP-acid ligase II
LIRPDHLAMGRHRTPTERLNRVCPPDSDAERRHGHYALGLRLSIVDQATDPTGNLQITDRIKDVIKSGGEWISSLEIESLISLYPGVAEVAVIGIRDEKWGERPVALVVLNGDAVITQDDISVTF